MAALVAGSLWFIATHALIEKIDSGFTAWLSAILIALCVSGIAVGASHFVLRPTSRPQVIYRAINGVMFSIVVGFSAYLGFDRWSFLYREDPASATLWGLITVAILFGFYDVMAWFIRSVMFRSVTAGEVDDLLSLTKDGRWRVAIHEAGHAVAYGLCTTVPEDAYACIEPDLLTAEAGAVGFPRPTDASELTKERIEWMMLCTEAGPAAEELIFGDRCILGAMDMNQLNGLAFTYLMSGFGEVISLEPKDEHEVQANRSAIGRLREKNKVLTTTFLAQNRDLIEQLARRLVELEYMDCEELEAGLRNVAVIEGQGLVSWPASIPSIPRRI